MSVKSISNTVQKEIKGLRETRSVNTILWTWIPVTCVRLSAVQQKRFEIWSVKLQKGKNWTLCKPRLSPFLFSSNSRDECGTSAAAFLWWQEGHAALRSQRLCCLLQDSSKTAKKNQTKCEKKQVKQHLGQSHVTKQRKSQIKCSGQCVNIVEISYWGCRL